MATLNLGRIKPVFRGAYSGSTAYVVDDIVTHGNESFICIQAHGAGTQATSVTAYWTKLAAKGTDGTDVGTTITTQGDILYRDGSGLQRLAKPASTKNLQMTSGGVPSWETVSSDFVHIKTQTVALAAGVAYVDFIHGTSDVVFDSTYNTYKFIVSRYAPQNADDLYLQVIVSSAVKTSGYICESYRSYYTGGSGRAGASDRIAFGQFSMIGSSTVDQSVLLSEHTTTNPSISQYPQVMSDYSGAENSQLIRSMCAGKWQTTTTGWNGMRFKTAGGGDFEGTIALYGLKA